MTKILSNPISNIKGFLVSLSPEVMEEGQVDKDVIKESALIDSAECIRITLEEGKEVLAMEPFPWEWICDIVGTYWDKDNKVFIEEPKFYYDWLAKILAILEEEAKKQGKL